MNPALSENSSNEELIGQAAGEFFEALSRGERPSIDEFAVRFPDIAEHIRRTFPALLVVGDMSTDETSEDMLVRANSDRTLGDFRIVRELGRGGMGTVFEAEQLSMGRRVALKVLPFAALVQDKSLQRFRNEVRAAAALDHPHIVSIYSVGEERGVHFFAMQLIRGQTLADAIAQLRHAEQGKSQPADSPIDHTLLTMGGGQAVKQARGNSPTIELAVGPRSSTKGEQRARITTAGGSRHIAEFYRIAARLGIQAAEALQHAHDLGVLHRDIKPSNLMLDAEGELYITDFGLARIEADAGVTMTGDVIGTLRYMAPEQALGKRVVIDQRADIYSLGATLYELLTLQPTFGETDRAELLKLIAFEEPRPLRKLNLRIPVELETIVSKAMAKIPEDRYETSQQLADDLRAFLDDRPIKARPASFADQVRKWSRRHQMVVRTAGIALVLLSGLLAVSTALVKRAQTQAVAALKDTSDLLYTSDMTVAYQTFEKGWSDEVQSILDRHRPNGREPDRRGLEWHLLQKLVQQPTSTTLAGHQGKVNELAVFPDRRRLASVGEDGTLRIWDVRSAKLLRTITICDQELYSVAISPDGRFVVSGNTVLYLCDLEQADRVTKRFQSGPNMESLAFSADGQHLAIGARYEEVCLLSVDGLEKRIPCASRVESLEYVTGGPLLLVPNRRPVAGQQPLGIIQLWADGLTKMEQELDGSRKDRPADISMAKSSPCGKFVVAGERYISRAQLFELASGRVLAETPVSRDMLTDVAYSPDGKAIAISYRNGRVECFNLQRDADGKPSINRRPLVISAHEGEVRSVRFVDAKTLASCGNDGLVRIWNMPTDAAQSFDFANSSLFGLKLSPDGSRLLYASNGEFLITNMDSGEVVFRRSHPKAVYCEPDWSLAGDKVALGSTDLASVDILDRSGQALCSISHGTRPEAVAFSPDGSLIAIVGGQQMQFCRSDNGRQVFQQALSHPGSNIVFSHDGIWLAYGGQSETVVVFGVRERKPLRELACSSHTSCLAFSPDDSLLATGHGDSVTRLWEVQTGRLRAELVGHERTPRDLAFSPDGRTLLSCAYDGAIRVWSVDHCRGYGVIYRRFEPGTTDAYCRLSLSSDGRRLAVGYGTQRDDCPDVLLWQLDPSLGN